MAGHNPTKDEFARIVIERLKQAGDTRALEYDAANFRIHAKQSDGAEGWMNLERRYDLFLRTPVEERREWWAKFIRGEMSTASPEKIDFNLPDLFPQVRLRSYFDSIQIQMETEDDTVSDAIPYAPVGDYLGVGIVRDLPEQMMYASKATLKELKLDFKNAFRTARKNLEKLEADVMVLDERIYMFVNDDSYDGSRIFVKELLQTLKVKGDLIAVLPNRNRIFLAGSNDADGLVVLAEVVEQAATNEPDLMCPVPLRYVNNKWETWLPPQNHRSFAAFRRLQLQFLHGEHETQKELLVKMYEKKDIDIFVATFKAMETNEGRLMSYAAWGKGVTTLLPRVDEVTFVDLEKDQSSVAKWEDVVRVVGHRMTPDPKRFPPRWLVDSFPTEAEMKSMGATLMKK